LRFPLELGVNVTLMVQFPLTGTLVPQLLVCVKFALFVPVNVKPVSVSGTLPVLVNVTGCEVLTVPTWTLPNASDEGVRLAEGATPFPVNDTVCVPAPSMIRNVALREPVELGVSVTLIVQLAPTPKLVPQLFVCK
jgi:hypothetical protein